MKRPSQEKRERLARIERAIGILDRRLAIPVYGPGKMFVVFSEQRPVTGLEGLGYLVSLKNRTCTCPDFVRRSNGKEYWCKHLIAAWLLVFHPEDYRKVRDLWKKRNGFTEEIEPEEEEEEEDEITF